MLSRPCLPTHVLSDMSMAETFLGFIGDRGAPLVVEGTKQWAQVSLPTHPETEMHMILFISEKHTRTGAITESSQQ